MKVEGQRMAVDPSLIKGEVNREAVEKNSYVNQKIPANGEKLKTTSQVNEEEVKFATRVMNEAMQISNYHLEFRIHKASSRIQVKVIDSETNKVIREIPPEKILECSARLKEMIEDMAGILIDEVI